MNAQWRAKSMQCAIYVVHFEITSFLLFDLRIRAGNRIDSNLVNPVQQQYDEVSFGLDS